MKLTVWRVTPTKSAASALRQPAAYAGREVAEVEGMNQQIVAGGCTTTSREAPIPPFMRGLVPVGLYVGAVAVAASLLSLLAVVLYGPILGPGERFESVGLGWVGSQPFILVCSVLSGSFYARYRGMKRWFTVALFFVANTLIVSVVAGLLWWLTPVKLWSWLWSW